MNLEKPRRVFVISDLHLGGDDKRLMLMTQPESLANFIDSIQVHHSTEEILELVIAGDFVDFLAIKPFSAWTSDPEMAETKLSNTMNGFFAPIFDALARFIANHHLLTILIGNHDVEFVLPSVQQAFLKRIGATYHQVHFVDNGQAYRIGNALVEHGNRYDGANMNDWNGLRVVASALSRGEKSPIELEISAGSLLVEQVVNKLTPRYPFITLLQPEGMVKAFLLQTLEPSALGPHWLKLGTIFQAAAKRATNKRGKQPNTPRHIAYSEIDEYDHELADVFGNIYTNFRAPEKQVAFETIRSFGRLLTRKDSLINILSDETRNIPQERLIQVRKLLKRLLPNSSYDRKLGETEQYGKAAKRILKDSNGQLEVVVMGHTHLEREMEVKQEDKKLGKYINTGTWADVIRIESKLLDTWSDKELEEFLRETCEGTRRMHLPHYAELLIQPDGKVIESILKAFEKTE